MAAATAADAAPESPPAQPASSPASGSPAEPRPAASTSPFPRAAGKDSPTTPSAVTALILIQGEQRGSGVLLRRSAGGTWLVTNRHVVDGHEQVCVRTADGRLWPGIPLLPARASSLDLAFVWLGDTADALPVAVPAAMPASAADGNRQAWNFAIVRASGYPVREERLPAPPSYREVRGLLLPQLRRPLEGGLQLASTSPVRKGMSGGGLFDAQGRLIGLNATHADPLWSAPLREEGGNALPPELNRQLELVALAIPVSRILPLLADLEPPGRLARMTQAPTALRRGRAPLDRTLFSVPAAEQRATVAPVCTGGLW